MLLQPRLYTDILAFASLVPLGGLLLNLRAELKSKTYSCANTNGRKTRTKAFVLPIKKNKRNAPTTVVYNLKQKETKTIVLDNLAENHASLFGKRIRDISRNISKNELEGFIGFPNVTKHLKPRGRKQKPFETTKPQAEWF